MEIDKDKGFALYAENDNCVAKAINIEYWQGDLPDPDLAYHLKIPILVLLMILIVFEI